MPKSLSQNQLPKAVEEFEALVKAGQGSITPEAVMNKEIAAERNKAATAMRHHLKKSNPSKLAEYEKLQDNRMRAEWLAEYMLAPSSGGCVGKNFTKRTNTTDNRTTEKMLTVFCVRKLRV